MKYKIGDYVYVRNDLVVGVKYGEFWFDVEMARFRGKLCQITNMWEYDYQLKCVDGTRSHQIPFFDDEMFEDVSSITLKEFLLSIMKT